MSTYAISMWLKIWRLRSIFKRNSPYVFLDWAWQGVWVSNLLCLCFSAWYYSDHDAHYRFWLLASAMLSFGPMTMASASIAPLPETLKRHILLSAAVGISVVVFSFLMQHENPLLLSFSVWLMLLLIIYQSRLHALLEQNWMQHEDNLAVGSAAVAFAVYTAISFTPILAPLLLLIIVASHRTMLWKVRRKQKLALEQHSIIWPHLAKNKPSSVFWSSIFIYVNVHRGIPPKELRHTLGKLDMKTLLAYFHQESVLLCSNSPVWYHRDLENAIKECVCILDNRAQAIFEMYSAHPIDAAVLINNVHSGNTILPDCMALPNLEITGS